MQSSQKLLFEIAERQEGFFTAKQAINCGFSSKNHQYFVKNGKWIKEGWGIYRLANYPITDRPDLMKWYLWSRNKNDVPQAVFSHETALMLYNLSDIMPDKIHLTVPKKFRKFNKIPKVLKIYKMDLSEQDIRSYLNVKVTTPIRTIIDIIEENIISQDLIYQAIKEAISRGIIISPKKILEHPYLNENLELKNTVKKYL